MVNLELTEQQAGALLQLIDIAIKSGGLNVAEAGVFFNQLIQPQLHPQDEAQTEEVQVAPEIDTSQVDLNR